MRKYRIISTGYYYFKAQKRFLVFWRDLCYPGQNPLLNSESETMKLIEKDKEKNLNKYQVVKYL